MKRMIKSKILKENGGKRRSILYSTATGVFFHLSKYFRSASCYVQKGWKMVVLQNIMLINALFIVALWIFYTKCQNTSFLQLNLNIFYVILNRLRLPLITVTLGRGFNKDDGRGPKPERNYQKCCCGPTRAQSPDFIGTLRQSATPACIILRAVNVLVDYVTKIWTSMRCQIGSLVGFS